MFSSPATPWPRFAADGAALAVLLATAGAVAAGKLPPLALLAASIVATLAGASRPLPFQNVAWAACVIVILCGVAHTIAALTGIVFGPFLFTAAAGPRIAGVLPWWIPLMWVTVIVSSRGMARLIVQPWHGTSHFGIALVLLSSSLSVLFGMAFDPCASANWRLWIWRTTAAPQLGGTPLTALAGWFTLSVVAATCVMPLLIRKKPGAAPIDFASPAVWLTLVITFAVLNIISGRTALGFSVVGCAMAVGVVAFRNVIAKNPAHPSKQRGDPH